MCSSDLEDLPVEELRVQVLAQLLGQGGLGEKSVQQLLGAGDHLVELVFILLHRTDAPDVDFHVPLGAAGSHRGGLHPGNLLEFLAGKWI